MPNSPEISHLMGLLISLTSFAKQMDFYDNCLVSISQRQFAINLKSVAQPQINHCKMRNAKHEPLTDPMSNQTVSVMRFGPRVIRYLLSASSVGIVLIKCLSDILRLQTHYKFSMNRPLVKISSVLTTEFERW